MTKQSEEVQDHKLSKEEKEKIRKAQKNKKNKEAKKTKNKNTENVDQQNVIIQDEVDNVEIEYLDQDEYLLTGKYYEEFKHVFQHFKEPLNLEEEVDQDEINEEIEEFKAKRKMLKELKKAAPKPNRKQRKEMSRMKVSTLKSLVKRPDLAEGWDITSPDPLTLLFLKGYKNTIVVPNHWCQKRKFLQNKRGIMKQQFKLPDFIEATGISKLRDITMSATHMVHQRLRERMKPRMGKMDIDYQVLHDAFFKYCTKPKMTEFGDAYFEGKENDVRSKNFKPGKVSEELRNALGISEFAPPPWIINMQRYGPPPAYPNLKIPGLNYPLEGGSGVGSFIYQKVLENAKQNIDKIEQDDDDDVQPIDKGYWGELIEDKEIEEDYNYNNNEQEQYESEKQTMQSEAGDRSGISSIFGGGEFTPEIDIRKQVPVQQSSYDTSDKPLYQVIEPVNTNIGGSLFGSTHTYKIPGQGNTSSQEQQQENKNQEKKGTDSNLGNFKF